MPRLTEQRALRAPLPASKAVFLRCSEVKGFNARIAASGTRTWYVDVTQNGKTSKIPLGPVGVLSFAGSPEDPGARDLAIAALAAAKRGKDAGEAISKKRQPKGLTLNDIWGHYETAGFPVLRGTGRKRESTISADKLRWQKHVAGTLGKVPVAEIGTAAVQRFLDRIPTEGQRAHTLVLVKSILSFAASRGLAEPQRIELTAKKSKLMQNFYGNDELAALDMAAAALTERQPHRLAVFAAIRLLLHSGCRASEIFTAEWRNVDLGRRELHLERDKATEHGRTVHLSDAAVAILTSLPRLDRWLLPSDSKSGHLTTVKKAWDETIAAAGVRRFRLHDLRHSYASAAINDGVSLYVAGKLLGHKQATTTQRYAHLEASAEREAVDRVAGRIALKLLKPHTVA